VRNIRSTEDPLTERVDWIDEAGATLESLPRSEIRRRNLLHRVSATFVFHPDGRLFVHRRTETKDVYPGLYDVAVGGTVVSGETFEENACRELGEELGVKGAVLYRLFSHRFQDRSSNSLTEVFASVTEGPFRLQPEEVSEGSWMKLEEITPLIAAAKICPDSVQAWRLYLKQAARDGDVLTRVSAGKLHSIKCSMVRS
jgi:isopentenyldiphosphate isomerase